MFELAVIVLFLAILGVTLASFSQGRQAWAELAAKHGLTMRDGYFSPVLEGRYAGLAVEVRLVRRGGGRNRNRYTRYRVTIGAPMPSGFRVRQEGLLHLLGKVIGIGEDIQVGNPELDDALMISGNDMVRIIRLLNLPEVGAAVLGMVIAYPRIEIDQSIEVEEHDMATATRIEEVLDALCDLARALEAGMQQLAAEDGQTTTPAVLG